MPDNSLNNSNVIARQGEVTDKERRRCEVIGLPDKHITQIAELAVKYERRVGDLVAQMEDGLTIHRLTECLRIQQHITTCRNASFL